MRKSRSSYPVFASTILNTPLEPHGFRTPGAVSRGNPGKIHPGDISPPRRKLGDLYLGNHGLPDLRDPGDGDADRPVTVIPASSGRCGEPEKDWETRKAETASWRLPDAFVVRARAYASKNLLMSTPKAVESFPIVESVTLTEPSSNFW